MNIKINKKAPQELMRSYGTLLAGPRYIQSNFFVPLLNMTFYIRILYA